MNSKEMFEGFSPEQQAKHEEYLIGRFGDGLKESIAESKQKVKNWTQTDWERSGAAFAAICTDVVGLMKRGLPGESREVQQVIRRHYEWLKQFWTPTRESYSGHAQMVADSDLRKAYEAYHAKLPEFMAAAIKLFAEKECA